MNQDKLNINIERIFHTAPTDSFASIVEEVEISVRLDNEVIFHVRQTEELYRNSSHPIKTLIDWCFGNERNSSLPEHGTRNYDEFIRSVTSEAARRMADSIAERTKRLLSNIDNPVIQGLNQKPDPDS